MAGLADNPTGVTAVQAGAYSKSEVDIRKTFAIAGISISSTNEPYSIPGKSAAG